MNDFKLKDCISKIENLNNEERIKIIWGWIKQGHINLSQFKILVNFCY